MKQHKRFSGYLLYLVSILLFPLMAFAGFTKHDSIGAAYTMSNAADGNSVLAFDRDKIGRLTPLGEFPTEGLGTGTGLGNQGAVILDPANRWLFVVNPGSDDISVFEVHEDGLELIDRVPSNGEQPISLTFSHNLLYVLNAGGSVGGSDSITGFHVGPEGELTPIADSTRPLSAASTAPAQIQFNSDGDVLVVTEKATDTLDTYTVDENGIPGDPIPQPSAGATPFGFAFGKRDQLFVSEAAGGATDQSSLSSYVLDQDGTLNLVSSSVATTETAACWVVVSNDGRVAYTTNAGSGSVSAFRIDFDGEVSLLDRNGKAGRTGRDSTPIDMALSNDGRNLYTLNAGNATISVFRVDRKGGLERLRTLRNLPVTANGLAAR
jgi:6-phosphogluconolactonase (cycloisomerase 2 family)